ncbi:helicase, partial [Escherichia coli]|nr:helicase [Escherichia coli]
MNEHIGSGSDALFEYTFNEYQKCARLLISDENQGRDELIKILEKKNDYSRILDGVLADLIESAGFYPYIIKNDLTLSSSSQKIRFENN